MHRQLPTLFVALGSLLAGAASAADLPSRAAMPSSQADPVRLPLFTWSGFYAGANAGYGSGLGSTFDTTVSPGYFPTSPGTSGVLSSKRDDGGFLGGAQIGYNYQIGHIVIGAENDIQYFHTDKGSRTYTFSGSGAVPSGFQYGGPDRALRGFATGRGRLGYAFDDILLYGTAGLAYGSFKSNFCTSGKCTENKLGYVGGAGVEYALTNNWSVKLEGLYASFGKSTDPIIGTDDGSRLYQANKRASTDLAIVRAGLNYRF